MRAAFLSALGLVLALGCASRGRDDRIPTDQPEPIAASEPSVRTIDPFAPPVPEPIRDQTLLTAEADEPTAPAEPPASPLEQFEGNYRFSGGSAQKSAVKTAIESVVDEMGLLSRGIARKRLMSTNDVPSRIAIDTEGQLVTVRIDGRVYTAKLEGSAVKVRDIEGNQSRLRYEMRGESLYMILDGEEGDRYNVFTTRDDGKGITMRVTIASSRLPKSVKYRLTYRDTGD
jgi:hypothetical protein